MAWIAALVLAASTPDVDTGEVAAGVRACDHSTIAATATANTELSASMLIWLRVNGSAIGATYYAATSA